MKRKKRIIRRKTGVRRERDPIPWKYCLLTFLCGLILVGGFFFAARLHFSSIEYGIGNSTLRREVEKLKSEKRRMILRREMALSGINRAARKIGFRRRTASNIEVVSMKHPKESFSEVAAERKSDKSIRAFTNSKTLVQQKPVKLKDIENKITKTIINLPRNRVASGKAARKKRKSDIREPKADLIAKKR